MQEKFEHSKRCFEQLAAIVEKQGREGRLCPKDVNSDLPFNGTDLNDCIRILKALNIELCVVINKDHNALSIDIPMWTCGFLSGGPTKGYLYSKNPTDLTQSLDGFAYTHLFQTTFSKTEGCWLRPLNNSWYIYYRFEK